jgi:hypothetical protein
MDDRSRYTAPGLDDGVSTEQAHAGASLAALTKVLQAFRDHA